MDLSSVDGWTALLLLIGAVGAALTALKVWVWTPASNEMRRQEALSAIAGWHDSLEVIVTALTPDHGTSVADFVEETRDTVGRLEDQLAQHCAAEVKRMDNIVSALAATNLRIDHLVQGLAGIQMRQGDREGLRTRATD